MSSIIGSRRAELIQRIRAAILSGRSDSLSVLIDAGFPVGSRRAKSVPKSRRTITPSTDLAGIGPTHRTQIVTLPH